MLKFIDKHYKAILWLNICLLFAELSFSSQNSLDSHMWIFLWAERVLASLFLYEYVARASTGGKKYITSVFGIIDLLAWLPFMVGFFVPVSMLGWVRALRILRMAKQFKYDRRLQIFVLAIWQARKIIQAIGFVSVCIALFSAVLICEAEKAAQPEFANIWNVLLWFIPVTGTTVGYGDMSPITIQGKFFAVTCLLLPLISIAGALLGVVGTQCQECIQMDRDGVAPLEEFRKNNAEVVDMLDGIG